MDFIKSNNEKLVNMTEEDDYLNSKLPHMMYILSKSLHT